MAQNPQLQAIERQLSCPHGDTGVDFAHMMHNTNLGMTQAGFAALKLPISANLLEIGHGNAAHVPLLQQVAGLHYSGLEVSELMQQEAMRLNQAAVNAHMAEFFHYDGVHLPNFQHSFDGVLSVNTVYFWTQPLAFLQDLRALLKPTGRLSLVYMDEHYMRTLPFVGERFHVYPVTELQDLVCQAGFTLLATTDHQDQVPYKDTGKLIDRQYHVSVFALA
ncbi:class I SAM-dependent methyltransferase [Vitreoscilla massiliensis]|uniref:Class I SAM-dependent methyltransferase n=1 Tax=Vitreoscilla massiliensis TaxID=1689272 RepID=A0ABY4DZK7_9NEIS|nr:class I SAM-dependent methyltransferase [Vitreoscilla massiliensis]UOO87960.1 class I SAM-dependent methyltransferase [Vitreoscilla massiliensis]